HAVRGAPMGPEAPGPIEHIKRYSGAEKVGHEAGDEAWKTGSQSGNFSLDGRIAVNATKQLIQIVVATAASGRGQPPPALVGGERGGGGRVGGGGLGGAGRWGGRAAGLSERTNRHYHGLRVGANNLKTLSMDEEGLATALVNEVGTNTPLTRQVFERLDEHYNSDADDVAEIYVNQVRKRGGALLMAVQSDKALIARLIKVMDEGWTSSGEKECIKFLRGLR